MMESFSAVFAESLFLKKCSFYYAADPYWLPITLQTVAQLSKQHPNHAMTGLMPHAHERFSQ